MHCRCAGYSYQLQCKRILTVRELARAQGFPDDFIFYSELDNIDDVTRLIHFFYYIKADHCLQYHKQIGNRYVIN